jgi:mono/diheme cytochrome c family protein
MSPSLWTAILATEAAAVVGVGYVLFVASADPQQAQASAGRELYVANCAKCHGADLEGQPDWKRRNENGRLPAPPHDETGHTSHHSDKQLFTITKFGLGAIAPGYESDMPAFENILTDDEIRSILEYIKSTWLVRARDYQAERSRADP